MSEALRARVDAQLQRARAGWPSPPPSTAAGPGLASDEGRRPSIAQLVHRFKSAAPAPRESRPPVSDLFWWTALPDGPAPARGAAPRADDQGVARTLACSPLEQCAGPAHVRANDVKVVGHENGVPGIVHLAVEKAMRQTFDMNGAASAGRCPGSPRKRQVMTPPAAFLPPPPWRSATVAVEAVAAVGDALQSKELPLSPRSSKAQEWQSPTAEDEAHDSLIAQFGSLGSPSQQNAPSELTRNSSGAPHSVTHEEQEEDQREKDTQTRQNGVADSPTQASPKPNSPNASSERNECMDLSAQPPLTSAVSKDAAVSPPLTCQGWCESDQVDQNDDPRAVNAEKAARLSKRRIRVLWDVENISIPKDKSAFSVASRLHDLALELERGAWGDVSSSCYCRTFCFHNPFKRTLTRIVRKELVSAFVTLVDVGKDKIGSADLQIIEEMENLVRDFSPEELLIVVVSNDADFVPCIRRMMQAGYKVACIRASLATETETTTSCAMFETFAWRVLDWQTLVLDLAESRSLALEDVPSKETNANKEQAAKKNVAAKARRTNRKKLKFAGPTPPHKGTVAARCGPNQVARARPASTDPSRMHPDSADDIIVLSANSSPQGAPTAFPPAADVVPNPVAVADTSASLSSAARAEEESSLRPSTQNGSQQQDLERQVAELRHRLLERLAGSRKHKSTTERALHWMPSVEQLQVEDAALSRAKALEARIVEELAQLREVRARFA